MITPKPSSLEPSHVDERRVIDDASGRLRPGRICAWCRGPIDPAARRDALTCSKACRQAKARFRVGPSGPAASKAMRFAYSDPPYPGLARKYYDCEEVDHQELIDRMCREFPDGWALSTSEDALQDVLAMCPAGVRVASWIRGARQSVSWRPRSAWEPLIICGGRPVLIDVKEYSSDVLIWGGRQPSHPGALIGMKPAAFAEWMFQQLGATRGDELVDLYPGSGAIGRAWDIYTARPGRCDESTAAPSDGSARAARDESLTPADPTPRGSRDLSPAAAPGTSCLAGAERRLIETLDRNRDE